MYQEASTEAAVDPTHSPLAILSSDDVDDSIFGWQPQTVLTPLQAQLLQQVTYLNMLDDQDAEHRCCTIYRCFSHGVLIGALVVTTEPMALEVCQPMDIDNEGRLGIAVKQVMAKEVTYINVDWMHQLANNVTLSLFRILWDAHFVTSGHVVPELPFTVIRCPLIPALLQSLFLIGFQPATRRDDGVLEVACFPIEDLLEATSVHALQSLCQHSTPPFTLRVLEYFTGQVDLDYTFCTNTILLFNSQKTTKPLHNQSSNNM